MDEIYDLAIVGAGLSALSALDSGVARGRTALLEHQDGPGGLLRYALPAEGFGEAWSLLRAFCPPANVVPYFGATVVGLMPAFTRAEAHTLVVRVRSGTLHMQARRVLIAAGGLELTREQARIPGSRPAGIVTPVFIHQLLERGYLPGKRAVVYGDSLYALATARRLRSAGLEVVHIAPPGSQLVQAAELVEMIGFPRLVAVRVRQEGRLLDLPADTCVYAAAMGANTRWLKGSGIALSREGAVLVDGCYQTNVSGVFAIGSAVVPSLDHAGSLSMGKEVGILLAGGVS